MRKYIQSTPGNSNLPLTRSNFQFPSDHFPYNFTLDNSNFFLFPSKVRIIGGRPYVISENSRHSSTSPPVFAEIKVCYERKHSILMTCYYPDLRSASDWLKQISQAARPIRSTTQIWLVTRHQYGISALASRENSCSVDKCRLFSHIRSVEEGIH